MKDFVDFFGLSEDPFRITPDIEFFYMSSVHQEALGSLEYLLESEEGFAVIIGEPGTGKTITIRKFLHQLDKNVEYAYILFPNLSPEELLKAIVEDFGLKSSPEMSKNKIFSILRDFLIQKKSEGKKILIIVDEAQNLPDETLEELRILSNMETEKEKLIQIILLGQPELEEKLESQKLRQLRQRITIITHLRNLSYDETVKYINYRFAKAGNPAVKIGNDVYKKVYKLTGGNLRKVNLLMERTLMSAYVENTQFIENRHVEAAAKSLKLKEVNERKFLKTGVLTVIILIVLSGFIYTSYKFISKNNESAASEENINSQFSQDVKLSEINTKQGENKIEDKSYGVVKAYMLNMREEPSKNSDVVYLLKEGEEVKIIEKNDEWIKVQKDNVTGWVKEKYIIFK
ncbi:AAA family ATPase [Persephonella sp.]